MIENFNLNSNQAPVSLSDLVGKSSNEFWVCTCPQCGHKSKLSVSKKTGHFHCFRASCNCEGTLLERTQRTQSQWDAGVKNGTIRPGMAPQQPQQDAPATPIQVPPSSATQYHGLTTKELAKMAYNSVPLLPHHLLTSSHDEADNTTPYKDTTFAHAPLLTHNEWKHQEVNQEDVWDLMDDDDRHLLKDARLTPLQWKAVEYLAHQHLSVINAAMNNLTVTEKMCGHNLFKPYICYLFFVDGKVVNVKGRCIERHEGVYEKDFEQTTRKGTPDEHLPLPPWGIDCLNPRHLPKDEKVNLVITEGEKDALTLRQCGFDYAISVPGGTGSKAELYFAPFKDWLNQVEQVTICPDTDEAGKAFIENAANYFGQLLPVKMVHLTDGCKDVSEYCALYGREATQKMVMEATAPAINGLRTFDQLFDESLEILKGNYDHGLSMGVGQITDTLLRLPKMGGLTVVTGVPNCGKSDWLNFLITRACCVQDSSACWFSFEKANTAFHAAELLKLMMGTEGDCIDYYEESVKKTHQFMKLHHLIMDTTVLDATPQKILETATKVWMNYHFRYLVIDPYAYISINCSIPETQAIGQMLKLFIDWAHQHHVWVFIVAHPTKLPEGETQVGMYGMSGSAQWTNMSDFIISVARQSVSTTSTASVSTIEVVKSRFQHIARTGKVYMVRKRNGRYQEFDDKNLATNFAKDVYEKGKKIIEQPWVDTDAVLENTTNEYNNY